jgi:hypothetical protein
MTCSYQMLIFVCCNSSSPCRLQANASVRNRLRPRTVVQLHSICASRSARMHSLNLDTGTRQLRTADGRSETRLGAVRNAVRISCGVHDHRSYPKDGDLCILQLSPAPNSNMSCRVPLRRVTISSTTQQESAPDIRGTLRYRVSTQGGV